MPRHNQSRMHPWNRYAGVAAAVALSAMLCGGCPSPSAGNNPDAAASVQGPAGPQGPEGAQGLPGPAGPQGEVGPTGAAGVTGATGPAGPAGADGQLRIYGDGSSGAYSVTGTENWLSSPPDSMLQYTDFTVSSGTVLFVPSGTVIRCTGTFTNNGTVAVFSGARGGFTTAPQSGATEAATSPAAIGLAALAAQDGEYGDSSATRTGGSGGLAQLKLTLYELLNPGPVGGAGGGGGIGHNGGSGGGSLVILAATGITNGGIIAATGADGGSGCGGGGGGFVVLASKTQVTNAAAGTIDASGGDGGVSVIWAGTGGGGGGGVIHLIAPSVSNQGSTNIAAGTAGMNVVNVTQTWRSGGAGGGACGGNGGTGATINAAGNQTTAATAGTVGWLFLSTTDPTALF